MPRHAQRRTMGLQNETLVLIHFRDVTACCSELVHLFLSLNIAHVAFGLHD